MLMRFLLLTLAIVLLWRWWSRRQQLSTTATVDTAAIVTCKCAECGLHVSASTAVTHQHLTFCSPEHCARFLAKRHP